MTKRASALCASLACALLAGCGNSDHLESRWDALIQSQAWQDVVAALQAQSADGGMTTFESNLFPLLRDYCAECHANGPGTPQLAHPDFETAYQIILATQKVNLSTPEASRLVRRLIDDLHYCWEDCDDDSQVMRNAIESWAVAEVASQESSAQTVNALASVDRRFSDGIEADDAGRMDDGAVGLWKFSEGTGTTAFDESSVAPAMNLELSGTASFMSAYGIDFAGGMAMATRQDSIKLYNQIGRPQGTQQYTVEAWVTPGNVTQEGPARIISYSGGNGSRNFTLGQVLYNYNFRNRTVDGNISNNGTPALQTNDDDQDLQATLQHVVVSYDQYRGRRVYVNGEFTDDDDEFLATRLWNWDPNHQLVLGNEVTTERPWLGQVRLLAIYPFPLTDEEIAQNFAAGVGRRLLLTFDVSQYAGPGASVEFAVSEFDDYSYLFCEPHFITPNPTSFRVENMRIAVNGSIPVSGQAFVNVDRLISTSKQRLSRQCSIVPKVLGPGQDVFTIEFEQLSSFRNPVSPIQPIPPAPPVYDDPMPAEGFRSFDRLNETMAEVTGVDPLSPDVAAVFQEIRQALPVTADLRTFSSAQQVAVAKLALEYCDALVEDTTLRDAFFGVPGPSFGQDATQAFSTPAQRQAVFDPMIENVLGTALGQQPDTVEIAPLLDTLVDDLTTGCTAATCPAEHTETVVKAVCAAVLQSAAASVH